MSISTDSIGEYEVIEQLGAATILARDSGGRRVVLKMLEADCLLKGQLHPMIRDRLGRVRELAHLGVANLHGAQRDGERAFVVWEYVEGQTLAEHVAEAKLEKQRLAELAQQIVLQVESLHALGIVHGALHARNIFVMPSGEVRLTHVSPLLYHEEAVDVGALEVVIREMGLVIAHQGSLEGIGGELRRITRPGNQEVGEERAECGGVRVRRWGVFGAIVGAAVGAGVAWVIWKNVVSERGESVALHWQQAASGTSHPNSGGWSSDALVDRTRPHPNPLPEGEGTGASGRGAV